MKFIVTVILVFLPSLALAQSQIEVIDGDTIELDGRMIRIFGIDAPETKQKCKDVDYNDYDCGVKSKEILINILGLKSNIGVVNNIDCTDINKDRYRRWVSVCFINGLNIGREMVRRGAALAYRQYSLSYEAQEDEAKAEGRGVWQGDFIKPWEWRAKN